MRTYATRLIEGDGEDPICFILTSDRKSAARSAVANAMNQQENGLYVGVVEVWDQNDPDEPVTRYGWQVELNVPDDWDWDDEEPEIDVAIEQEA